MQAHPEVSSTLTGFGDNDPDNWLPRLSSIQFDAGDAMRGQKVFETRQCQRCHLSTTRLGPDLVGITNRLSREELFVAIIDPSREVPPSFQTRVVVTESGRTYHGIEVYQSPEGTLLQTNANETVRIAGEEIVANQPSSQSLMPAGLLDGASDQELADLYAYLKTLHQE
jgi:putative heme-binding domain-containing protein